MPTRPRALGLTEQYEAPGSFAEAAAGPASVRIRRRARSAGSSGPPARLRKTRSGEPQSDQPDPATETTARPAALWKTSRLKFAGGMFV